MSVSRETLRLQRASSFIMHLYVQTHKRLYVNRDWRASSRDQRVAPSLPQPKRPMTIETRPFRIRLDRKSVVKGKSGSVREDLGGRGDIKKKYIEHNKETQNTK